MLNRALTGVYWFLNLFDPPPLNSMTLRQKVGRVVLVWISLVTTCILAAMFLAMLLFIEEKGRHMMLNTPNFLQGCIIVFIGLTVNATCIIILLMIRRIDSKLMSLPEDSTDKLA